MLGLARVVLDNQLFLNRHWDFSAFWFTSQGGAQFVDFYFQVAWNVWQYFLVCTGGSDLEWDHSFATLCNVNQLAWFNLERWAVNTLTVNQDVLVNNQLAGLCDGTGE